MKKVLLVTLVLVLTAALFACTTVEGMPGQTGGNDGDAVMNEVKDVVEGFGKKLREVSLLAPEEILGKSMAENYGDFVSQELIAKWLKDPQNAPGRLTSSPWPDRIEIRFIIMIAEKEYEVKGSIIEITSKEVAGGGIAAERPVALAVKKSGDQWLIDDVTMGDYKKVD